MAHTLPAAAYIFLPNVTTNNFVGYWTTGVRYVGGEDVLGPTHPGHLKYSLSWYSCVDSVSAHERDPSYRRLIPFIQSGTSIA